MTSNPNDTELREQLDRFVVSMIRTYSPDDVLRPLEEGVSYMAYDRDSAVDFLEALLATQRNNLLAEILEELPEKRKLVEPVTKRPVDNLGDKVEIDVDADMRGSLIFVQDNGFNQALDEITALIRKRMV